MPPMTSRIHSRDRLISRRMTRGCAGKHRPARCSLVSRKRCPGSDPARQVHVQDQERCSREIRNFSRESAIGLRGEGNHKGSVPDSLGSPRRASLNYGVPAMKSPHRPSRPDHHQLALTLAAHFPDHRKNQLELLVLMVFALIQAQTVRHAKLAERFPGTAKLESVIRRIERFFHTFPISQADIVPLILACLPAKPKLTLILDRTNWQLGQATVNVLVLSVLYQTTAIPLLWEFLPHGGSSSQTNRIDLLEDVLSLVPAQRIECVLADREFIGESWFEFLSVCDISLCIRLRDDSRTDLGQVKTCFEALKPGVEIVVYGVQLNVMAVLSDVGQRVVIASSLPSWQILGVYRTRFRVECMFRFLKSKGFRWEETHMLLHDRLDRLVCLLVIVFVWCVLVGHQGLIRFNKYGRLVRARFSLGLSLLTRAFCQAGTVFEGFVRLLLDAFSGRRLETVGY